ncbi:MAG: cation transporter [Oscillospiraceae bacterium]|nr:cation transporter [Oscillospiraceae bacterium]
MKKTYKLIDLDCANCAAKMERAIAELPEVKSVSVSFLKQKMSVELEDESIRDEVMKKIVRLIEKVEPDCELVLK